MSEEIRYETIRVKKPAADKIREVVAAYKKTHGVTPTQSDAICLMAEKFIDFLARVRRITR